MRVNKLLSQSVRALAILLVAFLLLPQFSYAASGVPKILNYQGRLMDSSGVLLGGSGTQYCFKFSFYDNANVGSGTKLWPSNSPSTMTVTVTNGVFNVGIGDTSVGGDTLDYNFQDNDSVYLNVDVAAKVGPTCAPGDGAETYETLGPRQRIYSSGFAINASTLEGYSAAQILAQAFSTTSADSFITQRNFFSTSSADFFASQRNFFSTSSADYYVSQNNFFSTSSADYHIANYDKGFFFSTTSADAYVAQRNFFSTSSVDFWASGINFFSTSSANFFVDSSSTVVKTYMDNVFGGMQTFANASTTNFSASYASSTQGFFGSLSVGSLTGVVRAVAGAITTGLVNLASDVTGVLPVANGGTGWTNVAAGAILYGNGAGSLATTTAALPGQVLAYLNGVPTWTATTTYSGGLIYANGNVILDTSGDWSGTFNGHTGDYYQANSFSTTSANYFASQRNFFSTSSADYYKSVNDFFATSSAIYFADSSTTIPKTYTSNTFSLLNYFNGGLASYASSTIGDGTENGGLTISGGATTTGTAYFAGRVGIGTTQPQASLDVRDQLFVRNADGVVGSNDGVEISGDSSAPRVSLVQGNRYVGLFSADAPGNLYLKNTAGGALIFNGGASGNTEIDRITNEGFLGIGTTSPGSALSVQGNQFIAGNIISTSSLASIFPYASSSALTADALFAAKSASLASTTAYGRFITGNIISTSTATSTFAGALDVGTSNSLFTASFMGATTGPSGSVGSAVVAITNDDSSLSSGNNILRLNMRTPGQNCTTGTTCPRFIEFFAGTPAGSDLGGTGLGRIAMSTQGTGITQTSGAADFAEYMQLNSSASVGDLVSLNSAGQYQKAIAGQSLIGVVSDNPAFVGNGNLEGSTNAYVVGFAGVIETTVSDANGAINAGDFIAASSTTAGVGVKLLNSGYTLGQALESWSGPGTGTIKVLVLPKYIDAAVALQSYGGSGGGESGYWNLSTTTGIVTLASSTYSLVLPNATITNASTTAFSSAYASSTQGFFGSLSIGNLSGILKATAGVISPITGAFVNLATDVTGILPVANGGTGWANLASGAILYGNGTDAVSTTTTGLPGQVLALLNGIPTWTSTTTFSGGLAFSNGNVALDSSFDKGFFFSTTSADYFTTQRNFFSTTSADYLASQRNFFSTTSVNYWKSVTDLFSTTSASYFLSQNQGASFSTTSAIYFVNASTTIPKTYLNNTFTSTNTFNGTLTFGTLNGPLDARNGVVGATSSIGAVYGGTGQTSYNPGDILYANSPTSLARIASTTSGTVLALLNGIPTWTATTTFSGALSYASGNVTFSAPISSALSIPYASSTSFTANNLFATNATTTSLAMTNITSAILFANASGSVGGLNMDSTLANTNSTLGLNLNNANTWAGLQIFSKNASSSQFSADTAYFGGTSTTTIDSSGNITFGNNAARILLQNAVDQALNFATSTGGIPTLTISTRASQTGLVGIGTSTPWGKFAVEMGTANPAFIVSNQGSSSPALYVGGINQNGLVGVGTSSPWAEFSVDASNGVGNSPLVAVGSSTGTYFLVNNGGRVGIGTSNPQYELDVNGDVNVASGNCFRVGGVCIGYTVKLAAIYATSTPGTSTVQFTGTPNSVPSFSGSTLTLQSNLSYYVVEMWGGGGGGGAQATNAGAVGAQSCYAQGAIACGGSAQKQLVHANGGNGGAAAAGTAGAGGASDTTFGGVSLPGGNGLTGSTAGTGNGGSSPRGGGTAASSPTGQTGTAGSSPGGGAAGGGTFSGGGATQGSGGGGGAYSENVASTSVTAASTFTVGAGGNGGAAGTVAGGKGAAGGIVITLYATSSPNSTGNDYAELFPVSSPLIEAGDIVAVDKGIPVSMKLATAGDNAPLAGVISTQPGQTLGDQTATGMRPVALSGRVPVKVNLEGGLIRVGDRIALSSVPGIGKKAGMFDDSVGIAIGNYDGTPNDGKVMVFIDLERGVNVNQIAFSLLGSDALSLSFASSSTSTPSSPLDFVGGMMNAISKRIFSFGSNVQGASSTASSTLMYASSSPTAVDGFAESLIDSIVGVITNMLANAQNGIGSIFANALHAKQEICVDDQCMSKSDVKTLLKMAHSQTAGASAGVSGASAPDIEIQGNNPATINIGEIYNDLGAVIKSPQADVNLGIQYLVDGLAADAVTIDTSYPAEHTVTYRVIDPSGAVGEATRTIRVVDPNATGDASTTLDTTASSTPDTPASSMPETTDVNSAPDASDTASTTDSTDTTDVNGIPIVTAPLSITPSETSTTTYASSTSTTL